LVHSKLFKVNFNIYFYFAAKKTILQPVALELPGAKVKSKLGIGMYHGMSLI